MPESNTPDRSTYVRVTQVLAPFAGLAHIPEHILQAAADRGTAVHKMIDATIDGLGMPEGTEDKQGYMDSYMHWLTQTHRTYRMRNPKRLYDDERKVTGEYDAIYLDGDAEVLVDFKTSAREGKTWPIQGVAYAGLLALSGVHISRIEFIKLDKNGKPPQVFHYKISEWARWWPRCLYVYRRFFDGVQTPFEEII